MATTGAGLTTSAGEPDGSYENRWYVPGCEAIGAVGATVVVATTEVRFSLQPQSAQVTEDESPIKAKAVTIRRDIVFSIGSCEPSCKQK